MKSIFTILLVFTGLWANAQTTYTLGVGDAYDYNTLQAAHDAALAGDIILVQPGGGYGNATLSKPLTIIGQGYYLQENEIFNSTNTNALPTSFNNITIDADASGSFLSGLDVFSIKIYGNGSVVERSNIDRLYFYEASNIIIRKNYISSYIHVVSGVSTNILFSSNLFLHNANCGFGSSCDMMLYQSGGSLGITEFYNNIFLNPEKDNIYSFSAGTGVYKNNIFLGDYVNNSNVATNNIFVSTNGNIPSNNISGIDPNTIFVGYPTQGTYSPDARWQLAPNSPAIGAGENGTDCGIFGGDNPYELSGIPSIPLIYELNVPQETGTNGLPVEVKIRTNN